MTTYYCGPGGSDANAGTSWALRKLTLAGLVAVATTAGDIGRIGAGIYRETLTTGAAGSAGNLIRFLGDPTGEFTDNAGGLVQISGSANDTSATRANAISCGHNYVEFADMHLYGVTAWCFTTTANASHGKLTRISYDAWGTAQSVHITGTATDWILDTGHFIIYAQAAADPTAGSSIQIDTGGNAATTISNYVGIVGATGVGATTPSTVGIGVRANSSGVKAYNCTIIGPEYGMYADTTTANGFQFFNCNLIGCIQGFRDRQDNCQNSNNNYYQCSQNANSAATQTNTTTNPPLMAPPPMNAFGLRLPFAAYGLLPQSALRAVGGAGASPPTTDLYGMPRPQGLGADIGAVQGNSVPYRDTTTLHGANASSIAIPGRGYVDFEVPCTSGTAVTVSCYAAWDNNANIGSKPMLSLLASNGITQQDSIATGTGGYEALSVTATPTSSGILIARVWNRSTYTSAINAYFSDLLQA